MASRASSRPILRPGLRVYRRDDNHLQIGIDRPRVVLPDSPGVRRLLSDLAAGAGLDSLTPDAGLAYQQLVDGGLVVEHRDLTSSRAAAAPVFATHGPDAPARLAARSSCVVDVRAPERWRPNLMQWLGQAGVGVHGGPAGRPSVVLLVTVDEPPRSLVDPLVVEDRPHLLLMLGADQARLGPFVVPGVTACLRCLDAHFGEHDPRRALVLEQLEDAAPAAGPYDPVLAHAATALAVRDLTSYAEGDRPATWSTTITVGADLALPHRTWSR
ncbi:MAG: hypothetical protein ABIO16_00680, partial [Nocardioides sp.]